MAAPYTQGGRRGHESGFYLGFLSPGLGYRDGADPSATAAHSSGPPQAPTAVGVQLSHLGCAQQVGPWGALPG